jgi:uncharacterized protein YlxW (UPF0749 family)
MNGDDMGGSEHSGVLEPTMRARIDELHDAVRENRVVINALAAEFGNWRKEPRLRTLIDIMQSELESHRQALEKLATESAGLKKELAKLKNSAGPTR